MNEVATGCQPMDLTRALPALAGDGWRAALRGMLESALGLKATREAFQRAAAAGGNPFDAVISVYDLRTDSAWPDAPRTGPLMLVANHPFGGADALFLGAMCLRLRREAMMFANEMVAELPGVGRFLLPLSILGAGDAARKNAPSLRRALGLLKAGGALAVFPSGEVAHWRGAGVEEGSWSPHIAALALRTGATVLPVRFSGGAPPWFHLLGGLHPLVRTALLPRVMLAARGGKVDFRVGEPVAAADHADTSPEDFAAWLRSATLSILPD
jgi:putative hemolysin